MADLVKDLTDDARCSRRALARSGLLAAGGLALAMPQLPGIANARRGQVATPGAAALPEEIIAITQGVMDELHLRATILQVMIDGDVLVSAALGESISGVPATVDMRFRNGAVAISLISTLMLTLVDDGVFGLDDPIVTWMPDLPDADTATLRMLANMTAGYRDHVQNPEFVHLLQDDPFQGFDPQEILSYSLAQPRLFTPGANWEYSHSNYFVLGLVMEAATGQSVEQLMQDRVLDPLGLSATVNNATGQMADPALHAFTSERRASLGIESGTRFYEESTYWNPSWTITQGAVQTTTIEDFAASMVAVGEGALLSPESSAAQLDRGLLGFGAPLDGCNTCHTLDERLNYGLGVVLSGPWIAQNPMFYGGSGVSAYLPERKLSIAVANTYGEAAFDGDGVYTNGSVTLFQAIAAYLVPEQATPVAG